MEELKAKFNKEKILEAIKGNTTKIKLTYEGEINSINFTDKDYIFYYKNIKFRCFEDNYHFTLVSFIQEIEIELVIEGFKALNEELKRIEEL